MGVGKPIVVIIEDDPASAEALGFVLRDWGAEVVHGTDYESISRTLGSRLHHVHAIIADFQLGDGSDGVALSQNLRRTARQARVLVLSGSFRGQAILAATLAGFEFLPKPTRAGDIITWLDRACVSP